MKPTITTSAPIEGWDCIQVAENVWECTPSDEWIRVAAYFLYVKGSQEPAVDNWYAAEDQLIFIQTHPNPDN